MEGIWKFFGGNPEEISKKYRGHFQGKSGICSGNSLTHWSGSKNLGLKYKLPHFRDQISGSRSQNPVLGRIFRVESKFEVKFSGCGRPGAKN